MLHWWSGWVQVSQAFRTNYTCTGHPQFQPHLVKSMPSGIDACAPACGRRPPALPRDTPGVGGRRSLADLPLETRLKRGPMEKRIHACTEHRHLVGHSFRLTLFCRQYHTICGVAFKNHIDFWGDVNFGVALRRNERPT